MTSLSRLGRDSAPMVSRYGKLPSTARVQCPNCGVFVVVSLRYTERNTGDYEGVCAEELESGGLCGATLLLTVSLPKKARAKKVS